MGFNVYAADSAVPRHPGQDADSRKGGMSSLRSQTWPRKEGERYGLRFTKAPPHSMAVLTCFAQGKFEDVDLPSPRPETGDAIEFTLPSGEVLRDLEVRSNAHHGIHEKEIFCQWRVDLSYVRQKASFQIPVIIPEDGCIEVVLYVNREARQHVALSIPAGDAGSRTCWTSRPDIDESLLNIPEKEKDFPTQACRAFYMTSESSKDTLTQTKPAKSLEIVEINCISTSSCVFHPVPQVQSPVPESVEVSMVASDISPSVHEEAAESATDLVPAQPKSEVPCQLACAQPKLAEWFHRYLEPMLTASHDEIEGFGLQEFANSVRAVLSGGAPDSARATEKQPVSEHPSTKRLCPLRNWRALLPDKFYVLPRFLVPILEKIANLFDGEEFSHCQCIPQ